MNSASRGYGVKLWRLAAMVGFMMRDDEGEDLVDGKRGLEERC